MDFLINNFKQLTTTQENVEQLKKLVLQLGVQGKLTEKWREENPEIEPISVLLERIKVEKEQLIKEKIIKRGKNLQKINRGEVRFDIPKTWSWKKLGEICNKITDGFHNTPPKVLNGFPYILATHVKSDKVDWDNCYYVDEKHHRELYNKTLPKKGEILLVNIGAGCGTPAIIDVDYEFSFKNVAILKFTQSKVYNQYLKYYFVLTKEETYGELTKGGSQPFLSLKIINNIIIPFPPFAEQQAIVSKVDSLFAQIDQLHALAQKKISYRESSAKVLLGKINTAANHAELLESWQLVHGNFKTITQSKESVKQLRQTILQLAVQGKLTAKWRNENPDIEPASDLVKRIKEEKEQLVNEGKIRKGKPLPKVTEEEKPFELPESWEWSRVGVIGYLKSGNSYSYPIGTEKDVPYVKVGDMNLPENDNEILSSSNYFTYSKEIDNQLIPSNSIIFPKRGGAIATNKRKKVLAKEILIDSNTMAIVIPKLVVFDFFFLWFNTIDLSKFGNDAVIPQVNNKDINPILLQLPPFEEQKIIVSKINQLLEWCDELERKIEKRDSYQERIMQAVVKQAFEPAQKSVLSSDLQEISGPALSEV